MSAAASSPPTRSASWCTAPGSAVTCASSAVSRNKMKDPDEMEVVTNIVRQDLTCWRNSPKVQFGDSHGHPNRVGLHAFFECGFHRIIPNPSGQHVHFAHVSVHLH